MRRALAGPWVLALLLLALASPAPAMAGFGFEDLDVTFTDENGATLTQAGSHPFAMTTSFEVNTFVNGEGKAVPEGEAKDLILRQIEGFVGNPTATPRCPTATFIVRAEGKSSCPNSTVVGLAKIRAGFEPPEASNTAAVHPPVFNLIPPPGVAAKLGFIVLTEPVTVEIRVNDRYPYNVVAGLENVPQVLLFYSSEFTLWGNPASEAHDPFRGRCVSSEASDELESNGLCPVDVPEKPFLTLPRACRGPLATELEATSWTGESSTDTSLTHDEAGNPQGMTGCESLPFEPGIGAQATTSQAESASGLDFSIDVEDEGLTSPTGRAHADMRKIVATLPEGVTANPSAANGLGTCSVAQYESASVESAGCPEDAKLGTLEVRTPILEDRTLRGEVFLAEQDDPTTPQPGAENPFDSLLALYMVIRDPELGIVVTQAAEVQADPVTGQLITTVEDIPQFPLSDVDLHLRGGPRAPLITPPTCGAHPVLTTLSSWTGKSVTRSSAIQVTSGPGGGACPAATPPFDPGFTAGSLNNAAGAFSPFYMRLTRKDGDQDITRFSAELPPGMLAKLAGTTSCPDAAIEAAKARRGRAELAAPSCPGSSRIGAVMAGAGVGEALTYVPGSVYLAGPYKGAPLSAVAIVPAVAGPFDVGTVVTRQALRVDRRSGEVSVDGAASDPIPHILAGIPLKVRDVRVYVDRPNFTLNPTSCDPSAVGAQIWGGGLDVFGSGDDVSVSRSRRFQAANCGSLGFAPRLSLNLKGGTKRGSHPALRGEYRPRPGDANLQKLVLRLPRSAFLDQAHIRTICTRVQFAANACPPGAVYGTARAFTPLLDQPLEGPVYLRSSDHELPDFVADLHGLIDVEAVARIDSVHGGIRATFTEVPDAPLSKVLVSMQGAKKGLIVNSTDLCGAPHRANAAFSAHNGKSHRARPAVRARCGKGH
jgi:hypothetical protein